MVDKIIGPVSSTSFQKQDSPVQDPNNNFLATLQDRFNEVTSRMKEIPGLPGVYFINQPQQTLGSLNITAKVV